MKVKSLIFFLLISLQCFACSNLAKTTSHYPKSWWKVFPESEKKWWEILPHKAKPGEVILSKRTELGIFSNFGHTPFIYEDIHYASIEGLWQALKYPDPLLKNDPRNQGNFPYTRDEVRKMHGFEAKEAGNIAGKINKSLGTTWVSYKGKKFDYKDLKEGSDYHFQIISQAMNEKIQQNTEVKNLLIKTKGLILKPDHEVKPTKPKSYFYFDILMSIRDNL